ncbi:neural cell adhesion molecule L1.1-like isoform X1 [Leuresthes tenuis]|uniref:neural cell adhesion molecule L1.1-like isoform X1 n=2 Tax=Leuresthes tenuis TaxID=355514 RepID=UPI003B50B6A0
MCASQHQVMGYMEPYSPILLLILFSMPLFAQGAINIPKRLLQPPVLTKSPTSYTAFSQEDIYMPCEATGNPPPTFRWVKNGEEKFGPELSRSGTLQAHGEEPLEHYAGYYRCYASNTLGTAMTQTIKVIVEPQPVLLKQQKLHKRAYEGESIILTCNPPESSAPPHIHWMDKKMVHITQSERIIIGLDGNLYFSNLVESDSREDYICNAQYAAARTILPVTAVNLTVMPSNDIIPGRKPHLFHPTDHHTSVQALRGQSVTLECIPKGLPTPKVEWKKKDGDFRETTGKLENHNRWLYFDSITQADDGEYQCKAFNIHGSITHSFTVTVEAAPYWLKEPQNLNYAPGETVRLDCLAGGMPTPTVTWSINGQPIEKVDDEPRRSITSSTLILRDVEFADSAVYQCEATNKHGSILLNTYLFVIELPPQILSSDGVVYKVIEGGDVKLHCESFGSPRPQITWESEDMVPLLLDPRVSLLTNGTIELLNVSHEDSGRYTCSIRHTNISITANLEVFNRTVILTGPRDIHILRGNTAFLDCHFYKDPRLHKHKVIWKKEGFNLQNSSPHDKYTIFDNNTIKVTNVQLDDSARYSCEVNTELDRVTAMSSITVVAPPDPPTSLSLSKIEDNNLTLSWFPGSSHNSPIIVFIVEAQEEPHAKKGKQRWEEWRRVPGDFNHAKLILRPFCTYRFRVIAVNKIDKSSPSKPSNDHSTPPAVPDMNPTGVRSNSTDPGTLIITWDEMEKRLHNGQDFHYKVSWCKVEGANMQWKDAYVKSPPFLVNNTGTYTAFKIKVQAVNAVGKGPEPEAFIGHSGEDKPGEAPSGVSSTVLNSTVIVTWNQIQKVRGLLLGYKIYIKRLGPQNGRGRRSLAKQHHVQERERMQHVKHRVNDSWVEEVQGTNTSKEVTGLRLFSRYEVSVTAFNSKGESPRSPPHHFNTPEGAPGPPASLRFESPTERSLILYWSPPLETNGILLGYVVQYWQDVESRDRLQMEMISDPNVNFIVLDHLDPKSYYIFQVIARTTTGDGPPITERGTTLLEGVPPYNVTIVSSATSFNLSWVPGKRHRNHGFHIRYMRSAVGHWEESGVINSTQGFYSLTGLQPGTQYHLEIIHGNSTQWEKVIWTQGPGTLPSEMPGGFSTQGWLIGLISAIVLLVLILLILCLIKRNKGGKYAVKDREDKQLDSEAQPVKDETFGEYRSLESDLDEKRSGSQPSLCEDSKLGSDDSLAEYGDSVDIQFNEDGSFIGQYSGRGHVSHGNESSDPASPVNLTSAVPHPPITPSLSTILNQPS